MKLFVDLFVSFMIIGIGAYGGGMVTIPLIQHEIVTSRKWLAFKDMAEVFAIAQMTPGPIAINAATFTGFKVGGIFGSILATLSVVLPSMLILTFLGLLIIDRYGKNNYMVRFRSGMQVGVLSLIFYAVWSYGSAAITGWLDFGIALFSFLMLIIFEGKLHPIIVILTCGIIGMLIF
jgi:chromate transporter